ncbi:hypothetical protein [Delftia acidovorans]|uniref:hypothetical protein n=1 Tax=Delftia acidovorans TaxID=80866 RepID=UPI0035A143A8
MDANAVPCRFACIARAVGRVGKSGPLGQRQHQWRMGRIPPAMANEAAIVNHGPDYCSAIYNWTTPYRPVPGISPAKQSRKLRKDEQQVHIYISFPNQIHAFARNELFFPVQI